MKGAPCGCYPQGNDGDCPAPGCKPILKGPEMSTWKFKPGSIAALVYVEGPDGKVYDCIYMNETTVVIGVKEQLLSILPEKVQVYVREHFKVMFSLPVGRRQWMIDNTPPATIEVPTCTWCGVETNGWEHETTCWSRPRAD